LDFTYGVETRHFVGIAKVPNLSHYKMMVLNLQRVTENDNMILLQNEDWFSKAFIIRLLEGNAQTLQSDDWKGYVFHWRRL
jgi:hypothetical protein